VYFDDQQAKMLGVEDTAVAVEVPAGIDVQPTITMSIGSLNFETRSFSVVPQIQQVEPTTAMAGSTVTLTPDVNVRSKDDLRVLLFSQPLEVVDFGSRSIVVKLPDSITGTSPELSLEVQGIRGQPFRGLTLATAAEERTAGSRVLNSRLTWVIAAVLAGGVTGGALLSRRSRRPLSRSAVPSPARRVEADEKSADEGPPIPEVPESLAAAIAGRECVLFAGGGVSAAAGFPTWELGLDDLLERAGSTRSEDGLTPELLTSLRSAAPFEAVELLAARLGPDFVYGFVKDTYGREVRKLPRLASTVATLPFAGVVTTNWDEVVTKCFQNRGGPRLATEWEQLQGVFRENEFFLVKLHGDPDNRDSLVLTPADYGRLLERNVPFKRFVMSLYATRTFFFLGSSLRSIEQFLSGLALDATERTHHALVPYEPHFARHRARFAATYHVELLGYRPSEGHPEVASFVEQLRSRVTAPERALPRMSEETAPWVERVVLNNIGAFESLKLQLAPGWNVLLGDNGCGKSTILRAIALGLCGPDDRVTPLAANLLRKGATRGSVELTVGKETYATELVREGARVRVVTPQRYTPLESGKWLALGFPAIRGVSNRDPTEAATEVETRAPTADDLLPLLAGDLDTRLNDFKQWIYNAHVRSTSGGGEELERIFGFLESMTPGVKLTFAGIDPDTLKIMVDTEDGRVPLELLSQGTNSVIGWAGTLLQRMTAVYRGKAEPTRQPALVMVDELAAHMHPSWQFALAGLVQRNFENVQLVVATHSPLVLGTIERGAVVTLKRDARGRIDVQPARQPPYGWRAEDIYEFMGLENTRAPGFRARLDRFKELDAKRIRKTATEQELRQLEELRHDLRGLPGTDPVSLTMELDNLGSLLDEPVTSTPRPRSRA
jgi:hypothetical protein